MAELSEKGRFYLTLLFVMCAILLTSLGVSKSFSVYNSMMKNRPRIPVATKEFRRKLAEGVRVVHPDVQGLAVVSCGACRLEKMRKGPFTFGGFNMLILEDFSVVLPRFDIKTAEGANDSTSDDSFFDVTHRLGVSKRFLSSYGVKGFSGLRIRGLSVSVLQKVGATPEKRFTAESAVAVRGGLSLSDCLVYSTSGGFERVGKALLSKSGNTISLKWHDGEMIL